MAETYVAETVYRVRLTRVVAFRGVPLLPLPLHDMTGEALNEIVSQEGADAIDTAVPR